MEQRDEEHADEDDGCGDGALAYLRHEVGVEELQVALVDALQLVVAFRWALQEQRVAGLQSDFAWLTVDASALSGHSHEHHVVVALEGVLRHRCADEVAAEGDISRAQLAVAAYFVDVVDVVVGSHESVGALQVQNLVDLSGIDEAVAAEDELVVGHGHDDFLVEAHNLDQRATLHLLQSRFAHGHAHGRVVGRHKQFDGVVTRGFERLFGRFSFGNELAQHDDQKHARGGE